MKSRQELVFLVALALLCLFTAEVLAEAMPTHARLQISGLENPFFGSDSRDFVREGEFEYYNRVPYGTPTASTPVDAVAYGGGSAYAKPDFFGLLGIATIASTYFPTEPGQWAGKGSTEAIWRDVVYVEGAGLGTSIRLTFDVEGELLPEGRFSSAGVGFRWSHTVSDWGGLFGGDGGVILETESGWNVRGWDSIVYGGSTNEFYGTFHMDVPYDSNYGGYSWLLQFYANAATYPYMWQDETTREAIANSMHSVGFVAITDLSGNPLTGVTFDSGLVPIPEPSTYALAAIGFVALLAVKRRKG
jgi:hypothetical protein